MPYSAPKYPEVTIREVLAEYLSVSRRYWKTLLLSVVTTTIPVIATGIFAPVFYKHVFDLLAANSTNMPATVPALVNTILWILLMNGIGWVSYRTYSFAVVYFQTGIMNDLRQRAFEYVIGHSYSFFNNTFSGSLVQKINRYMRSFERVTNRLFDEIIPLLVKVVGISIVLWFTQPVFAVAVVIWMFVFFFLSIFFARWKIPYDIKTAEVESRATAVLSDSLSNHATIQTFSAFSHEAGLFERANTVHTDALAKKWNVANIIDAIQALMNICIEFIIFYIAIKYWGMGVVSIGTFILIQMYVIGLMGNFWGWGRILRDLYEAFADAKEAVEILKLSHGIQDVPGAKRLAVTAGKIDLNDVHFSFTPKSPVLDGVSLHVNKGERIGLVGPSGAGKSTLVRLLLRLYDIQGGSITIDGQDVKDVTQSSLREDISFVPQDPILFHRSLKDNIKYGRTDATDEEVVRAATLAHCHEFIADFPHGYDTFVGERGVKLSGGERQRVAIARALVTDPEITFADEPTGNLDSKSGKNVMGIIQRLNVEHGKTIVLITHETSTAEHAERIIHLMDGEIESDMKVRNRLTANDEFKK